MEAQIIDIIDGGSVILMLLTSVDTNTMRLRRVAWERRLFLDWLYDAVQATGATKLDDLYGMTVNIEGEPYQETVSLPY